VLLMMALAAVPAACAGGASMTTAYALPDSSAASSIFRPVFRAAFRSSLRLSFSYMMFLFSRVPRTCDNC